MKIDIEDFNRKANHIIETVVKPQVAKYEQSILKKMKAKELIKEIIKELTAENANQYWKINQLKDEINTLKVENRKLQSEVKSELNFKRNTVEL